MTRRIIIWRALAWAALIFAITMAVLPHPPHTPLDQYGDKVQHIAAFATMAVLMAIAYPSFLLFHLGERLSFLGALIEVVQSIPNLHRDCDIRDWLADTAAIVVVLFVIRVIRTKRADAPPRSKPGAPPQLPA